MPRGALFAVLAFGLLAAACSVPALGEPPLGPGPTATSTFEPPAVVTPSGPLRRLTATLVASGFDSPTDVTAAPGDPRLFVVEKTGLVRIVVDGEVLPEPFIDLSREITSEGNEQGLVTMELHPGFATNGRAYVFFTNPGGHSRLFEFTVSETDRNRLEFLLARRILALEQPHEYHQSGSMFFGPDGYLWVSLGDGGGIGDTFGNGQNPGTLHGTIVRLDVDAEATPYAIPPDNPFIRDGEARQEVWAYGVRNPWRITFDPVTGLVYIPDVGQEGWEEINVVPADRSGLNFGWPVREGPDCFEGTACPDEGFEPPTYAYEHEGGCAIIGGLVYRGSAIPELYGHYFYSDFCFGWVRSLLIDETGVSQQVDWTPQLGRLGSISSFGVDGNGEMHLVNLEGELYRIDAVRG